MKITLGLTLLLGLLSAVGPVSTDMYLPAFSLVDRSFRMQNAGQITLAAWFIGLAFGQMIQGSLSDRIGRRRPLLYGTLIYSVASVGCAVAPDVVSFSILRMIAAMAGSASMVVPRAVVRDVAEGLDAARLISKLSLVLGVVPILAPALGGAMLGFMGWRTIFWVAALYGVVCTVLVWKFLPDTLPAALRLRHNFGQSVARYGAILRERTFLANALQGSFSFAAMFAYLGGSATVYVQYFHLTPLQYGILFGVNAAGFIFCIQFSTRFAQRFGTNRIQRICVRGILAWFTIVATDAFTGIGGLWGLAVPMFFGQAMLGLIGPLSTVGALTHQRANAASASALMGTLQFGCAGITGALVGVLGNGTPRPMVLLMLAAAGLAAVADYFRPGAAADTLPANVVVPVEESLI